jgi:uncharacterized protein YeaO (DUF488 family)
MTRLKMKINAWLRDLGPSTALRKWFGHDPANWEEFRALYRKELNAKRPLFDELAAHARDGSSPSCSGQVIRYITRPS